MVSAPPQRFRHCEKHRSGSGDGSKQSRAWFNRRQGLLRLDNLLLSVIFRASSQ